MSNQSAIHEHVRTLTGTARSYNSDWHALFDRFGIAAGDFNGRLLAWINAMLGTSYGDLPGAMAAYAAALGYDSWSSMGGLYLDPLNDPDLAVTRADATATYIDANGVLQTAAADTPRWDYTNGARGLRIEESRTQLIPNPTASGAVVGTPGTVPTGWAVPFLSAPLAGVTRSVMAAGSDDGIDFVRYRLSGTPSGAGSAFFYFAATATSIAAALGETFETSVYMRLAGGSVSGVSSLLLQVAEYSSGGALLINSGTSFSLTADWQRVGHVRTMTNASVAHVFPYVQSSIAATPIDISIDFGLPNLTKAASPTSPIKSAATRNNDIPLLMLANFPGFNPAEGTFVLDVQGVNHVDGSNMRRFLEIGDGTANERIVSGYSSLAADRVLVVDGGATQADLTPAATPSTRHKLAFSYMADDFAACVNGGAVSTDTGGTLPTVDRIMFGHGAGAAAGTSLNGWIYSAPYFPWRLPDAAQQALSAA